MFQDLRSRPSHSPFSQVSETQDRTWVIRLRIHQLIARGDLQGSLSLLETTLGLSRQLQNFAPLESYFMGVQFENVVLRPGLDSWLQKAGSNKALLQSALAMLQNHAAARPDPANSIKAEYFTQREFDPFAMRPDVVLDAIYRRLAVEVPWERERQQRVFRAATVGALRLVHPPYAPVLFGQSTVVNDVVANAAQRAGLPPTQGPGSDLSANEWGDFILQSWPVKQSNYFFIEFFTANSAAAQQTAEVAVAVRIFQADHGRLPAQLEELVPKYLPALPNPTGMPTGYQFEETEELVVPILATNLVSMTLPSGDASLQFASALASLCARVDFSFLDDSMAMGGAGGGAGSAPGAGMVLGWPAPGSPEQAPLVPHAAIRVGNSFRIVLGSSQR
jgi:hypothetical protein